MRVISVANQKGGCGKTITSVNVAGALAAMGKNVLFVDIDPQAHATSSLGIEIKDSRKSSYRIFDAFLKNEQADVSGLIHKRYETLYVIGSHISLSTMEQKLYSAKNATMILHNFLKAKEISDFDYVIIDTPPNLGFLTFNALHASSRVIVPLDTSFFSLKGVGYISDILDLSKNMGFEKPAVNFLINMYDGRSNFAKNFLQQSREMLGKGLFNTVVRANVKIKEAAQAGKAIFEHDPSSNGARDYTALVNEMVPGTGAERLTLKSVETPRADTEADKAQKIMFKLTAPEAGAVYLAGSFNDWLISKETAMKKLDNGTWVKILSLAEGAYRYKFVVDDKWIEDPSNENTKTNEFGGRDSMVMVKF